MAPSVTLPTRDVPRWVQRLPFATGAVTVVVTALVFTGRATGDLDLSSFIPGFAAMRADSAIVLAIAAVALALSALTSRSARIGGRLLGVVVLVLGVIRVVEWSSKAVFRLDDLFVPGTVNAGGATVSSIHTGLFLALFGLALALNVSGHRWLDVAGATITAVMSTVVLAMELGFLYGIHPLSASSARPSVSMPSAIASLALCAGLLALKADHRPLWWLWQPTITGTLLRRLLVPAVVVPIVLGGAWLAAERRHWFQAYEGVAILVGVLAAISITMLSFTAYRIHAVEEAAAKAGRRARSYLDAAPDATVVVDGRGIIQYANPQVVELLGFDVDEMVGRPVEHLVPERARSRHVGLRDEYAARPSLRLMLNGLDLAARAKDGREIPVEISLGPVEGTVGSDTVAALRDVTDKRLAEQELREAHARYQHLAEHDVLTGLPNRRRFESELSSHLALCRRNGPAGALLAIDLDHFKAVNDTLGHHEGDRLLVAVAGAMRERLREEDVVARQGGDEFFVLLRSGGREEAVATARGIVAEIRKAAEQVGRVGRQVTASIGIAVLEGRTVDKLEIIPVFRDADVALYRAKDAGRDGYVIFGLDDSLPGDGEPRTDA